MSRGQGHGLPKAPFLGHRYTKIGGFPYSVSGEDSGCILGCILALRGASYFVGGGGDRNSRANSVERERRGEKRRGEERRGEKRREEERRGEEEERDIKRAKLPHVDANLQAV